MLWDVVKPRRRDGADDDESPAPLYFDFEDEDEPPEHADDGGDAPGGGSGARAARADGATGPSAGDAAAHSLRSDAAAYPLGAEAAVYPRGTDAAAHPFGAESAFGVVDHGPALVRWWSRFVLPRRRLALGSVVLVVATALAVSGTVARAEQRARDRIAMSALAGAYVPSADGEGLDLVLTLRDDGPAVATVIWIGVNQPGLALGYPPLPLPVQVGHSLSIKLGGRYTCNGAADTEVRTLTAMVRSPRGAVSSITLPMPSGAVLPTGWRDARTAFCAGMALFGQRPVS
jgi:hypothetical protein